MVEQQVDIELALRTCYVQILGAQGRHVGGGVLVDERHVVTCAHVVTLAFPGVSKDRADPPVEVVLVATPNVRNAGRMEATVLVWGPGVADGEEGDVAVLRLKVAAPSSMRPRPFALVESKHLHEFAIWGITKAHPKGIDVTGTIRMGRVGGRVRLEGAAQHSWPDTISGFSGTAVWDRNDRGIVGLLVSQVQPKQAYLIPTKVVKKLWADLPVGPPEHEPTNTYIKKLAKRVSEPDNAWSLREPSFDIHCKMQGECFSSEQIIGRMAESDSPCVAIKDRSGAGKSAFLGGVIRSLLGSTAKFLPVLCDLQSWDSEDSEALAKRESFFDEREPSKLKVILGRSVVRIDNLKMLSDLCRYRRPVILVDALDAVGRAGQRREVYEVLYEFTSRPTELELERPFVIIADRGIEKAREHWLEAQLTCISVERRRVLVDAAFGADTYDKLLSANQTLLQHPLLLDVALKNESPTMISITDGIRKLFEERLSLSEDEVRLLAETTFDCRPKGENAAPEIGTSVLDKRAFEKGTHPTLDDVRDTLLDQGVLVESSDRYLKYYHQRIHDYLSAIHLATSENKTELWKRKIFDRVTFESSDPGVLAMTLELLGSPEEGDQFLVCVYDWNWNAAMHAAIHVANVPERKCTTQMMAALLAMIKEKTFDDVLQSRARAITLLESVDSWQSQAILDSQGLNQLREAVKGVAKGTAEWFHVWRRVFLSRWEEEAPSEEDIRLIADPHSLVGWCAANALRRGPELSSELQTAVRTFYLALRIDTNPANEVIRWRAIHVLGKCPSRQNAGLMLDALDRDPYSWVRYGAARALMEIAARSQDADLTHYVLQEVQTRVKDKELDAKIQLEIGRCALTRAGTETWREAVKPLISLLVELNRAGPNSAEWVHLKAEFETDKWAL